MEGSSGKSFKVLPASRGMAWLRQSFAILRLQAGRLLFLAVLMQMIVSLVQVPILGLLILLSVPGLNAGILEAFHQAGRGQPPGMNTLFTPLASNQHRSRFFLMGGLILLISIICVSFVLGSTTQIDEALLIRLQEGDMAALEELDPTFMTRLMAAFLLSIAISGTLTFFSIPLVWFLNHKLGRSIGVGLKALMANWKPMLSLGLVLLAVFLPVSLLMMLFMQLALAGGIVGTLGMGLVMMVVLLFQLLLFGTQYCSFREIFGLTADETAEPGDQGDQLVA